MLTNEKKKLQKKKLHFQAKKNLQLMLDCLEQENCNTKNQASLSQNFVRRHQLSI